MFLTPSFSLGANGKLITVGRVCIFLSGTISPFNLTCYETHSCFKVRANPNRDKQ